MRNLIITGGIYHHFEESSVALSSVLAEAGIESEIVSDFDAAIEKLLSNQYDLLTVYALRWRMLNDEKYEPYRKKWALNMTPSHQHAIASFVSNGGGLLGLHTASICFDDWPEWRCVLGGAWVWNQSFHPPVGPVHVQPVESGNAIIADIPAFRLHDEVFHDLEMEKNVTPLLQAAVDDSQDWRLIAWMHSYGKGRVVCDLLGHEVGSMEQPEHRIILQRAAQWAGGALNLTGGTQ